jgi:hypothetical protein
VRFPQADICISREVSESGNLPVVVISIRSVWQYAVTDYVMKQREQWMADRNQDISSNLLSWLLIGRHSNSKYPRVKI